MPLLTKNEQEGYFKRNLTDRKVSVASARHEQGQFQTRKLSTEEAAEQQGGRQLERWSFNDVFAVTEGRYKRETFLK